jgi:hypothetical protein
LRLPDFKQSALEDGKIVSPTHRPPLPPGNIPGTYFCWRLSQPLGRSAAGRIMSMKNFNDTMGNRTRDLPACSAVPQPTAPQAACSKVTYIVDRNMSKIKFIGEIVLRPPPQV